MLSLLLRNLLFTILQPGLVAGLFPYWILGTKFYDAMIWPYTLLQFIGAGVFLIGLVIMINCIISFAIKGRGTLSPADPTKQLVVTGLYKFSRNPMYIGVILILAGEAIFFGSGSLWIYALFVMLGFNIFILVHEEPRLKSVFGKEYEEYCARVRRWI